MIALPFPPYGSRYRYVQSNLQRSYIKKAFRVSAFFLERQNSSIFIIEKAKKAEKVLTEGKGQLHNGIIYEPTR
jgi:hypothetical protein